LGGRRGKGGVGGGREEGGGRREEGGGRREEGEGGGSRRINISQITKGSSTIMTLFTPPIFIFKNMYSTVSS
jgi:hypothetical protein